MHNSPATNSILTNGIAIRTHEFRNDEFVINYNNAIEFGSGWKCCIGREAFYIVFEEGNRWAVCTSCAWLYTGPVIAFTTEERAIREYRSMIKESESCAAVAEFKMAITQAERANK